MSGAISASGCTFRSKQFTTKPWIVPTTIKATLKKKMGSMKLTAAVEITHYKFSCTNSLLSVVDNVLNVNTKDLPTNQTTYSIKTAQALKLRAT